MVEHTHLFREIHEQPQVLRQVVREESANIAELADEVQERKISHVVIAARGTSDNAGRYAQYLFGACNRLPVGLATPSLFSIYRRPPLFGNALVLGISQSGRSPDIVSVLAEARRQGALTAAITNDPIADLGREAEYVINLRAGQEQSVAATKTYTSELVVIALLSAILAQDDGMLKELETLSPHVSQVLTMNAAIAAAAERYRYMQHCVVIGRGYNYATAFELALKLKELAYIVVEPYSSADFLHGPMAVIDRGFPVFVIAPGGMMLDEMRTFSHKLESRGAEIITISEDPEILASSRTPLALPSSVPEWVSPVLSIIPGQLFAMHLAHARGYDVDRPRGLEKVTETR